jgi:hypothetical protein
MVVDHCECCGDETEGLFPIFGVKNHDPSTEDCPEAFTWCDTCWNRADCKGVCCGCCYKHESEEWWWRCMYCQRLAVPIPKEEPDVNYVVCEDCNGEAQVG